VRAVDNVQDTLGEASLLGKLGQDHGRTGVPLGGLKDVGVSAGDGHGEHPEGNHGGEVEGADSGGNSERLPVRVGVHILGNSGESLTHQKSGDGAGVLNDLCKSETFRGGTPFSKFQLSNRQHVSYEGHEGHHRGHQQWSFLAPR